jgi:hypothetical protein
MNPHAGSQDEHNNNNKRKKKKRRKKDGRKNKFASANQLVCVLGSSSLVSCMMFIRDWDKSSVGEQRRKHW